MTLATKAKSREQKDSRKNLIMDAVDRLFQEKDYKSIKMETIGKRAGLSKGTVFFYFKTKQVLFLEYTRIQIDAWHDELDSRLERIIAAGKKTAIDEFLGMIRESIREKRTLFRLVTILDSIIEVDVDGATLLDFKMHVRNRMVRTGELLERLLDIFRQGDGIRFYLYVYFIITGMYPMAEQSPAIKKLSKRPELQMWNIDFEETLMEMLRVLLHGWNAA